MERIKTVGTITGIVLFACGILNFTVGMGTIYIGFQQTARILWQIFQGTANGNILADVSIICACRDWFWQRLLAMD